MSVESHFQTPSCVPAKSVDSLNDGHVAIASAGRYRAKLGLQHVGLPCSRGCSAATPTTSGDLECGRSIPRNIVLRCYEAEPTAIPLRCKDQELLVVTFGLAMISDSFGRLCGTCKGAIAVRI